MSNTKTYFVSLAGKVPVNYEVRVKAKTEKEAYKKALIAHDNDNGEWAFDELLHSEAELDLGDKGSDDMPYGVHIEID